MIRFQNVKKTYHTRHGLNHVLKNANLTIQPGEKVGILGRNGAGKSTTIRLLSGAELPTAGHIERKMSVSWPLAFGGAFQGALTGRDNTKCICRIYGRNIADAIEYVQDFSELGRYFDEPVNNYSSGMAARLAFALSMSIEFDCFLIDEVMHVGDQRFHEKCQIELYEKRADRSHVIVSHDEGFVREHCERAYVLKDGEILSFDHVDEAISFHIQSLHVKRHEDTGEAVTARPEDPDEQYRLGPDSYPKEGVPRGQIVTLEIPPSAIFPNCLHEAWLYLPPDYNGEDRLPIMIFQDGWWFVADDGPWQVQTVVNNLIADGSLPRMAVLFVESGKLRSQGGLADEQRSLEYDSLNGDYARFLLDEVFSQVEKHAAISDDPRDRGIAGIANGGICAFTAAWMRPDAFSKVLSICGIFADIRGGGAYPDLISETDRKPIRVFLQEGVRSRLGGKYEGLDLPGGNRAVARALALKGYEHQFVLGEGGHSFRHGAMILPDAMRWLWRD